MKMIMSALLATGLVATPVASVNAKGSKAEHSGRNTHSKHKAMGNAVADPGVSFDGRSSLGGSNSLGSRKLHRAPAPSEGDEKFDGSMFFDDGMLNGG
jgi:hypothetical protein